MPGAYIISRLMRVLVVQKAFEYGAPVMARGYDADDGTNASTFICCTVEYFTNDMPQKDYYLKDTLGGERCPRRTAPGPHLPRAHVTDKLTCRWKDGNLFQHILRLQRKERLLR